MSLLTDSVVMSRDALAVQPKFRRFVLGRGDVPVKDLKFRCTACGSRMTDSVMMGRGGVGVQPWRSE